MKIILLSFLYEPELGGGAAVVVNQLAHLLVQKSYSVVVITTWKGSFVKTEMVEGIKIIRIPPMNLYWIGEKDNQNILKKVGWQLFDVWNPLLYRLVRQIIIDEKPDIVHSHKLRGLSPSIWSAAASAGVTKIIHTCHDYELLSPEGFFMGKVGKLAQDQNLIMRPYQILRRNFSKLVSQVTAPSRFVMNYHQDMGFFPLARKTIIPNSHGFDNNELQINQSESAKSQKSPLARQFLYLGRLDKAKGIDLLCKAFLQVADQKQDIILRISGWGPMSEALREEYKNHDNIVFTGPIFGVQKAEILRNTDVLIAPSVFQEPFGIVVTEAYSYGIPVITSKIGAFPGIVGEGETGFLVEPGSAEDLAAAILRISAEKDLITSMSGNCFEEARKYTTEKMLSNYLEIYEEKS